MKTGVHLRNSARNPARSLARGGRGALLLLCLLTLSLACVRVSYTNNTATGDGGLTVAEVSYTGQWMAEFRTGEELVQFSLRYESHGRHGHGYSNNGFNVAPSQLQGLTREQAMSGGTHVQFQLKRDAGTFNCEGWFKEGQGSGHYVFSPDAGFAAELSRQGYGSPSAEQQFQMALSDVGLGFIGELKSEGYERPTLDQLVEAGNHGVNLDYLKGLQSLGYYVRRIENLIELRDHGVHPKFIRELAALGFEHLSPEQLVEARDHGVNPELVRALRAAGYAQLSLDQLIRVRDHGVSQNFIRDLDALGYQRLPIERLVEMRDHGVSSSFIEELKRLGYERVPVELLIRLRDHGVSTGFIQQMKSRGYNDLDQMIEKRDRGEEN